MTNPNLSRQQFKVPASDLQVGDRLDRAGKSRVIKVHPTGDKVYVAHATKGTRSNGVSSHGPDEQVTVWRNA